MGKTVGIRQSVELIVQTRFPNLLELVMARVEHMQDPTLLQQMLIAMSAAQDEQSARRYLLAFKG